MSGELAKVIIRGFESPEENEQQGEVVREYQAMFNPESFAVNNAFKYDESQAESDTGAEFKFQNIAPREFSFDFVVDSTGASGTKLDIEEEVEKFKNATGFKEAAGFVGKERRSFYLTITWGSFNIRCITKTIDVKYTLFRPDGTPIRATISATFGEYKTPLQQARENPESILNLTQVRDVLDQDNLTNLAKKLYGDGKKYIDIAKANGIDNLKELVSGDRLEFPPVDQLASSLKEKAAPFIDQAQEIVQGAKKIAEGKDQVIQGVSQLAAKAQKEAEAAIAQAEAAVRGVQSQVEAEAQSLVRQGQQIASQVQTQAGQFVQEATAISERVFQEAQQARQSVQDAGEDILQSGREALEEGFDDITSFLDF